MGRRTIGRRNALSRRSFLAGSAGVVGLGAVAVGGTMLLTDSDDGDGGNTGAIGGDSPDKTPAIDPGPLQLQVNDGDHPGRVTVLTASGRELVHFDGYRLTSSIGTRGANVDDPDDGSPGAGPVRVEFEVTDPAYTAAVVYRAEGSTVTADWEFTVPGNGFEDEDDGPDGKALLRGGQVHRTVVDPSDDEVHVPATRWTEDTGGGVPFLERVTELHFNEWDAASDGEDGRICGCLSVTGSRSRSESMVNAPPAPPVDDADDDLWRTHVEFRADPAVGDARNLVDSGRTLLAGAVLGNPELPATTVDISGPGTYNVLTTGGDQTFTVGVAGGGEDSSTDVEVVAYSFTGEEIHNSTHTVTIPQDATYADTDVTVELPGPRSWCAVNVSCADSFARTAVAVWPDHDYGPPEQSIIGLSGFSTAASGSQAPGLESVDDERELWQRIGIKHLRNPWLTADESAELDISTAIQPAGSPGQFSVERLDNGGETFTEWATSNLDRGDEADAAHYELLNEWNVDGTDSSELATEYTNDWLIPFRDEMTRRSSPARLIAMALAGWDAEFLDTIHDNGGWDALDGIAEHAGRGNYVPDYDAGRWNFLGQVRTARAYLDGHAENDDDPVTDLWLTECYACTRPNAWWYDDERTSADSVMLSLLIAKAEGATGTHWFQLADGLWHDKHGVDPIESEYHYGLLRSDRSPKPSLPAFAYTAELLDGASFLGWVESPHPDLRGLRFVRGGGDGDGGDGGDGEVFWVLWSRQDGYLHNADHGPEGYFPHPEPWIVPEGGTLTVTVDGASGATNVLGADVPLEDGNGGDNGEDGDDGSTVTVGTSPVIVRGNLTKDTLGPGAVTGDMRVPLTDVTVRRAEDSDTSLVVEGVNDIGSRLGLRIMGRQVDGAIEEESVVVPAGDFSETVDMHEAMPLDDDTPAASVAGAAEGVRPQVRVMAQRRERTVPGAAETQVYRAEYYRSV